MLAHGVAAVVPRRRARAAGDPVAGRGRRGDAGALGGALSQHPHRRAAPPDRRGTGPARRGPRRAGAAVRVAVRDRRRHRARAVPGRGRGPVLRRDRRATATRPATWWPRRVTPTAADLAKYQGTYVSDEAEVIYTIRAEDGALFARRRPDARFALAPSYKDAFTNAQLPLVLFRRDPKTGQVNGLSLGLGRVRDLRLRKETTAVD